MIENLFSLFFVCFIFLEPLVLSTLTLLGVEELDGGMRKFAIASFVLALVCKCLFGIKKRDWKAFSLLLIFALLYLSTSLLYDENMPSLYISSFLRWGSLCVSAVLLGSIFTQIKSFRYIEIYLVLLIVLLTILLSLIFITNLQSAKIFDNENGLNYQKMSYFMAMLFGFTSYLFAHKSNTEWIVLKITFLLLLLVQFIVAAFSGGRGGMLLVVIEAIILIHYLLAKKIVSKVTVWSLVLFSIIVGITLFNKLDIINSAGFFRVAAFSHDNRSENVKFAIESFSDSFLFGHGFGSAFYSKFGMYYHNVMLDWLCETGVIGSIFLVYFLIKIFKSIKKATLLNTHYSIVLIYFFYGFFVTLFSEYWVAMQSYWLALGCYVSLKSNKVLRYTSVYSSINL